MQMCVLIANASLGFFVNKSSAVTLHPVVFSVSLESLTLSVLLS